VGWGGTILHYTAQAGRWEAQTSDTTDWLRSIFGTSDGTELWAVGGLSTILKYTAQAGRWEVQSNGPIGHPKILPLILPAGTMMDLYSIFGTSDGTQLWAVGEYGAILRYTAQAGRWEAQTVSSGTTNILVLFSIFGTSDAAQLWAVGGGGTILHYSAPAGRWEAQRSPTQDDLASIIGSSDGAQLWAVGQRGTILHYSAPAGRWEAQNSPTTNHLYSIFGTSDGAQLWAVRSQRNHLALCGPARALGGAEQQYPEHPLVHLRDE
jgi:photosystem II stability/assembly factor-like uncharacterized protein